MARQRETAVMEPSQAELPDGLCHGPALALLKSAVMRKLWVGVTQRVPPSLTQHTRPSLVQPALL